MSPAGMWSVCPRIHWCYKGCTGFCRATPSMDSMDGRSQKLLTRKKKKIYSFPNKEAMIPKCPCVTWGCQCWKKEPWKHRIRATEFKGEKLWPNPTKPFIFLTPALNSQHQHLEVSWTLGPNFRKICLDSLLVPKPRSNAERCEKGHIEPGCKDFFPFSLRRWFSFWKQTWIKPIFSCFLQSRTVKFFLDLD